MATAGSSRDCGAGIRRPRRSSWAGTARAHIAWPSRSRAALSAAIDELSPEYRAVVVLRDVEGLAMAEAATSLGISVASAKTRLHRARLFLRKRLAAFMATAS